MPDSPDAAIDRALSKPLLWEQQLNEPEDAWRAFKAFRDTVPPRRAKSIIGFAHHTVSIWYNEWRWLKRCDAYDRHLEKLAQGERERLLKQTQQEIMAGHLAMLHTGKEIVQRELDKLRATVLEGDASILKPEILIKMMDRIIILDRLVRGQSTENHEHTANLSTLSLEELQRLKEIRRKIDGHGNGG